MSKPPLTYALDIGTRKIAGLVLEAVDSNYRVAACKIIEQVPGAMRDGQIHDIGKVAASIKHVTEALQMQVKDLPPEVAVAAAGRTLKTAQGTARQTISPMVAIDDLTVHALEMQAVLKARESLRGGFIEESKQQSWAAQYIFVAHSPMIYYLDIVPIGNLIGHRGNSIGVDVIVTFLPRVVIDGLSASLKAAGLMLGSLTLEPIAAIEAAIPSSMRHLHLALVDVGAGTSDIALTRDGIVYAFGMVDVAGDEVTEALCRYYLLDFSEGEKLKHQFQRKARLAVQNVLGQQISPEPEEVKQVIAPVVATLAETIGQEVLHLTGNTPPQAVMCIGGGSLTPSFPEQLRKQLKLPANLIAVRDRDALNNVSGYTHVLSGPDSITPIAIAISSKTAVSAFVTVQVNNESVRLLGTLKPTVKDALLAAGIGPWDLQGRPGTALSLTINRAPRIIPGTLGSPALIQVNGETASLDTPATSGSKITIQPGEPGKDAAPRIEEIIELPTEVVIEWKGQEIVVPPLIMRNGKPASGQDIAEDRDVIYATDKQTVETALQWLHKRGEIDLGTPIDFTLNGQTCRLRPSLEIQLNGESVTGDAELKNGDRLQVEPRDSDTLTLMDIHKIWSHTLLPKDAGDQITITYNEEPIVLTRDTVWQYTRQGLPASPDDIIHDGDKVTIEAESVSDEGAAFLLNDIFRTPGFSPPKPKQGTVLRIRLNSKEAGFVSPLEDGDVVELYWE